MSIGTRIKTLYLELPIRVKLQLWFMPLLIVTAGSIGYFSYTTASAQVLEKISLGQRNVAAQTISQLDYLAKDIYDIYNFLSLSSELHSILSPEVDYHSAEVAYSMINRLLSTRQFFQSLLIYSDDYPTIKFNRLNNNAYMTYEDYKKSEFYAHTVAEPVIGTWGVEMEPFKLFIGDQRRKVFYSKVLINPENMNREGLMVIGMNEEDFRTAYAGSIRDNAGARQIRIVVVNEHGLVLSDSEGVWSGSSLQELPYYGGADLREVDWSRPREEWLVSHASSDVTGWHVLVVQPRTEELRQLNPIRWLTIGVVALLLVVNAPISWLVSRLFSRPLIRLLKSMRELQMGDFNQHVAVEQRDEIGQLSSGYNIMVSKIRELIEDVYQSRLSRQEAELRLLQSQINPHFLYNTLNSISWMAYREGAGKTADMILKLSELFRFSLSQGADVIAIEKETAIVEDYLYLCKIRFGDKLTYSIEVEEALKPLRVPKLIVQPLAENAVVHGIEPVDGQGFIHLTIAREGSDVVIELTDNGAGMPEDKLTLLRRQLADVRLPAGEERGRGFALLNVRDRLLRRFGDDASIDISSRQGLGTTVRLRVALRSFERNGGGSDV